MASEASNLRHQELHIRSANCLCSFPFFEQCPLVALQLKKRRKFKHDEHEDPINGFRQFIVVGWLCGWVADALTIDIGTRSQRNFGAM